MRNNDITSTVRLAVVCDRQRTGTGIAQPLFAGRLVRFHVRLATPLVGCPWREPCSYQGSGSSCHAALPTCRGDHLQGHMSVKRSCTIARS